MSNEENPLNRAYKAVLEDELERSSDRPQTAISMLQRAQGKAPDLQELILSVIAAFLGIYSGEQKVVAQDVSSSSMQTSQKQGEETALLSSADKIKKALEDIELSSRGLAPEHQIAIATYSRNIIANLDGGQTAGTQENRPPAADGKLIGVAGASAAQKEMDNSEEKRALAYQFADKVLGKQGEYRKTTASRDAADFLKSLFSFQLVHPTIDSNSREPVKEGSPEYQQLQIEKDTLVEGFMKKYTVEELKERTTVTHRELAIQAADQYTQAVHGKSWLLQYRPFVEAMPEFLSRSNDELEAYIQATKEPDLIRERHPLPIFSSNSKEKAIKSDREQDIKSRVKDILDNQKAAPASSKNHVDKDHVDNGKLGQFASPAVVAPLSRHAVYTGI